MPARGLKGSLQAAKDVVLSPWRFVRETGTEGHDRSAASGRPFGVDDQGSKVIRVFDTVAPQSDRITG